MRYLVVSDIHGHFKELKSALRKKKFAKTKDMLIILGDTFDRGTENVEVFEFIKSLKNVVWVKGNHDEMLEHFLKEPGHQTHIFNAKYNGFLETVISFSGLNEEEAAEWMVKTPNMLAMRIFERHPDLYDTLQNLPLIYETKTHIFVHADLNYKFREAIKPSTLLWSRQFMTRRYPDVKKTIVVGHTPVGGILHVSENQVMIDGGVFTKDGQLNVYEMEEE